MPWIEFQAEKEQLIDVLTSITNEIDGVLYETYSEPNEELRYFETVDELQNAYKIGVDVYGNGIAQQLSLWAPNVMPKPNIRTIVLRGGGTRKVVEGCGLFSIQLGGRYKDTITISKIGYFTEAGAKNKCTVEPGPETINWANHKLLTNTIRRIIKRVNNPANKALQPTPKNGAAEL